MFKSELRFLFLIIKKSNTVLKVDFFFFLIFNPFIFMVKVQRFSFRTVGQWDGGFNVALVYSYGTCVKEK